MPLNPLCRYRRLLLVSLAPLLVQAPLLSLAQERATLSRPSPETRREVSSTPRVQVLDWELASRYAYADAAAGQVTGRQVELRSRSVLQIRLDRGGNNAIQSRIETGNSFNGSWNETPAGISASTSSYNPKTFFLLHRFSRQVTSEAGGIEFERGSGTEATYAANEGYMTGYRATLAPTGTPLRLVLTTGYVGDFNQPDFFPRARSLGKVNHLQAMLKRDFSPHASGSVAMEGLQGTGYLRGAFHAKDVGRASGLGSHTEYVFEAVERLSGYTAIGWSVSAGTAVLPSGRLKVLARYSDLPQDLYRGRDGQQMLLNSGEIGLGRRGALITSWTVLPGTVLELLVARRLDDLQTTNRWRAFFAIHYNAGAAIRSAYNLRRLASGKDQSTKTQ